MGGSKLRVGAMDAGLVFRNDGSIEALIPRGIPKGRDIPDNVVIAEMLLRACLDPRVFKKMMDAIAPEEDEMLQ